MTFDEALLVYRRMTMVEPFRVLHLKRVRGEITDKRFLEELDHLQIKAEEMVLE